MISFTFSNCPRSFLDSNFLKKNRKMLNKPMAMLAKASLQLLAESKQTAAKRYLL